MWRGFLALVLALSILLPGCVTLIPNIITFEVSPTTITAGQQAILRWNVTNSSAVSIDQIGVVAPSGAQAVMPPTTTVYTMRASSVVGTVVRSVVLTVNPQPATIIFEINPATVTSGGVAILIWNVTGAATVSIDQGIGVVPQAGNRLVNPAATTTYTLTANNAGGIANKSVTLVVNPPVNATFTASASTIYPGQGSTLQWNVTGATSVSIEPDIGNVPMSGSQVVYPYSTTTYTLIASSECCSVSKSVTVTVGRSYPIPYPPTYVPFIEIFTVVPATITAGNSATISWYVVGATSVFISNIGYVSNSGSITVSPTSTRSYTLTASNSYFMRTRTIALVVNP